MNVSRKLKLIKLNKFITSHNGVEDLLSEEKLNEYHSLEWPNNVPVLYNALMEKLKTDPDYEVWVPMVYARFGTYIEDKLSHYRNKYVYISNKGRIHHINYRVHKYFCGYKNVNGYYNYSFKLEDVEYFNASLHRLVASSFVPIPDELKHYGYGSLIVNHKSGKKNENFFTNLEWCTYSQNMVHAAKMLLINNKGINNPRTKPLLATCKIKGDFYGTNILIHGLSEFEIIFKRKPNGIMFKSINKDKIIFGCTWKHPSLKEIKLFSNINHPERMLEILRTHNGNFGLPFIGRRISDGHITIFNRMKDLSKSGFDESSVYKQMKGIKKHYKGYTFFKLRNIKELEHYENIVNKQKHTGML